MDVHVYIGVADLEHGIAFYTQGIGLRLRRRLRPNWDASDGASGVLCPGYRRRCRVRGLPPQYKHARP